MSTKCWLKSLNIIEHLCATEWIYMAHVPGHKMIEHTKSTKKQRYKMQGF